MILMFFVRISVSKKRKVSIFEIEIPLENGGTAYIDSSSEKICTNMVIYAKPGQVRHTEFPFKCLYIHMVVTPGALHDVLMNIPTFIKTDRGDKYRQLFFEMIGYSRNLSQIDDIAMYGRLLEIIHMMSEDSRGSSTVIRKSGSKKNSNKDISVIERTLSYIDGHLTEDLSLERLARLNSVSHIHFHNTFRESTGKTLRIYVEERRIKKAVSLLITTDFTLTRIAYECGFGSQSYFSYAFKRRMNCSPREYVRRLNEKRK